MARRRDLGVLLATVLIATAGCDQYRDDAPPVAQTVRPSATPLASPPSGVWAVGSGSPEPVGTTVQRRATVLRVGPGLRPYRLLFHDTDHGYALLSDCPFRNVTVSQRRPDRHCRGALAATADAGRSWSMGALPNVDADDWLMTTLGPRELLLYVRKRYYESVDAGRTFTPSTKKFGPGGPIGVDGLGSVGQQVPSNARVECAGTVIENTCGSHRVVTLDRPGGSAVHRSGPVDLGNRAGHHPQAATLAGRLVLTGWSGRDPPVLQSAVTVDGGRTWSWQQVPEVGRRATLQGSPDGADAWLVPVPTTAVFPKLWRLVDERWERLPVAGHPTAPGRYFAAAAGGGRLAMAGPGGVGYVGTDGRWHAESRLPAGLDRVDLLADGGLALTARTNPHRFYLGTGQADRRNWTEIVVDVE